MLCRRQGDDCQTFARMLDDLECRIRREPVWKWEPGEDGKDLRQGMSGACSAPGVRDGKPVEACGVSRVVGLGGRNEDRSIDKDHRFFRSPMRESMRSLRSLSIQSTISSCGSGPASYTRVPFFM